MTWLSDSGFDYEYAGNLINKSWRYKKMMTPQASNKTIDSYIDKALKSGACGAKVCGSGGGGFMLVICDSKKQNNVRNSLKDLFELKFNFSDSGAEIIYCDQ